MSYLDLARVTGYRETDVPRHRRRQDGYGTLMPSASLLQIDGKRWHRVRTTCWSNSGTDFVRVGGEQLILATGWHHTVATRQCQGELAAAYMRHLDNQRFSKPVAVDSNFEAWRNQYRA